MKKKMGRPPKAKDKVRPLVMTIRLREDETREIRQSGKQIWPFAIGIERANLTVRTHCKRLARLTLALSKKIENFKAAIALHLRIIIS